MCLEETSSLTAWATAFRVSAFEMGLFFFVVDLAMLGSFGGPRRARGGGAVNGYGHVRWVMGGRVRGVWVKSKNCVRSLVFMSRSVRLGTPKSVSMNLRTLENSA